LNKQLTELQNKVSILEKENQDSQAEIANLKKCAAIPQVSFEYTNNKLFLIDCDKRREILTPAYSISEFAKSKTGNKIAVILSRAGDYFVMISNADGELSNRSFWNIHGVPSYNPPKNLKWVSDTILRVYLESIGSMLKFDHILLKGTGIYEITIDETNSLVNIKKLNI